MLVQWGRLLQPTGLIATTFPIVYESLFTIIGSGTGQDVRAKNGEPMICQISTTGFSSYYGDPYYNYTYGLTWVAIGI